MTQQFQLPTLGMLKQFGFDTVAQLRDGAVGVAQWVLAHPQLFTLVALLALVPAIFWLWLFIRKDHMDTTHRNFMALTFAVGMLSVLPVFLADAALSRLFGVNMHTLFSDAGQLTLGSVVLVNWGRLLYFVVCVGMLEEYSKHVVVKEVDYRRRFFNRVVDGIEFSVAAALGFAFIENILYFLQAWDMPAFTPWKFSGVVLIRSVGSMLAHVLFSGIFGYYYGRAKFLDDTPARDRRKHLHARLWTGLQLRFARIQHWAQGSHVLVEVGQTLRRDEVIAEGLLVAMVLHGLYNYFLDINRTYFIVPFLFVEFLFIWHELEVTENRRVHGLAKG